MKCRKCTAWYAHMWLAWRGGFLTQHKALSGLSGLFVLLYTTFIELAVAIIFPKQSKCPSVSRTSSHIFTVPRNTHSLCTSPCPQWLNRASLLCYTYTKTRDVCSKEQLQHAIDLDFACAHDATSPPRWRLELKLGALALPRLVDTKRPDARIDEAHLKGRHTSI